MKKTETSSCVFVIAKLSRIKVLSLVLDGDCSGLVWHLANRDRGGSDLGMLDRVEALLLHTAEQRNAPLLGFSVIIGSVYQAVWESALQLTHPLTLPRCQE